MSEKIEKENKFVVFNKRDLYNYFEKRPELSKIFDMICEGVATMRMLQGKKEYNSYICCNQDEPYAKEVWNTILTGEKKKEKN
jgi:hypothetical protein